MTLIHLLLILMIFSIIILFLKNPLSMGFTIMMLTLTITLILGSISNSFWFSYILFLTFLGGLLILFIYICSLTSNEAFNLNFNKLIISLSIFILLLITSFFMNFNINMIHNFFNLDMNQLTNEFLFFNNENKINTSQLYNNKFTLTMMMIIFLLITLIIVNKITNLNHSTFRTK